MFISLAKLFIKDESGQGITEYGAVLAFVGIIIALGLSAGHGSFAQAVQTSYSAVTHNLNQIAANPS